METKLHVNLGQNSYDIRIAPGLLADIAQGIKPVYPEGRVFVVTAVSYTHLDVYKRQC